MEALNAQVEDVQWIAVEDDSAPGQVRRCALAIANRLGFSEKRAAEVGIAATELATNLHRHAVAGAVLVRVRRHIEECGIDLLAIDRGPGIADFADVARDGRSTAGTLGIGLGAAMRLATWFDGYSLPGRGTAIVATFWLAQAPTGRPSSAALTRPMAGEAVCGDACAQRTSGGVTTVLLADGLGHGELAATAAREATRTFFSQSQDERPAQIIARLDAALRPTRGAAVAVARLDARAGTIAFAGVGNIAAWLDDGLRRHALVSHPGIVGTKVKSLREFETSLPDGAIVVLHSDGLSSKWSLDGYPGLRARDPHLLAATLLRDAGVRHDDASVLVVKTS